MSSAEEQQQLLEEEIRRKKAMYPELKAKAMELEQAVKGEHSWKTLFLRAMTCWPCIAILCMRFLRTSCFANAFTVRWFLFRQDIDSVGNLEKKVEKLSMELLWAGASQLEQSVRKFEEALDREQPKLRHHEEKVGAAMKWNVRRETNKYNLIFEDACMLMFQFLGE